MSNNIYTILGKLNSINDAAALTPDSQETITVYETVEAQGSILEAVRSLEEKFKMFGEGRDLKNKQDFDNHAKVGDYYITSSGNKVTKTATGIKHEKGYAADKDDLDEAAYDEPAAPDAEAIANRKRLQAIKDRQEEQDNDSFSDRKSNVRTIAGKAYGGAAQKDDEEKDLDESAKPDYLDLDKDGNKTEPMKKAAKDAKQVDEVAPPGAKAERMVKHIKKGYADDGKLTKREKGIAYATAWKAHNKGQVEEGCQFGDPIKNSAPNMKKAKLAKLKEGRVMEDTDYFYEKVGKALANKNSTLDTAGSDFVDAVRKEMIAQGIDPNRARNILLMDEDFLSDVATSYAHYCKEVAECSVPINSHLGGASELDEIAALAGLPAREATCETCGMAESSCSCVHEEELTETHGLMINGKEVNVDSIEVDGVYDWDRPDFADAYITYAEFSDGTPLSDDEVDQLTIEHGDLVNQAAHSSLQGRADFIDEDEMVEGNEFTKARLDAIAQGNDTFNVGNKTYKVTGDTSLNEDVNLNLTATGDEDVLALVKKLAGLPGELVPSNINDPVVLDPTNGAVPLSNIPTLELPQDVEVSEEYCDACDSTECHCEAVEEERDIELANTPHEQTATVSAVTTDAGGGIGGPKKQYRKEYPGDNPMAVESLWNDYQDLIDEVKAQ